MSCEGWVGRLIEPEEFGPESAPYPPRDAGWFWPSQVLFRAFRQRLCRPAALARSWRSFRRRTLSCFYHSARIRPNWRGKRCLRSEAITRTVQTTWPSLTHFARSDSKITFNRSNPRLFFHAGIQFWEYFRRRLDFIPRPTQSKPFLTRRTGLRFARVIVSRTKFSPEKS